ncbi:MAG: hypothetical protein JOZ38_03585 [Candidatus Eremiobacteraeota bacterium]|nr:hypothetical protein [Candidatus Eremiobacteraeota bacterium]
MKHLAFFASAAAAATLAIFSWTPAIAQDNDADQTLDAPQIDYCGAMVNGVWTSNGNCSTFTDQGAQRARVVGTITFVKGHLVTVQQSTRSLVVNDEPALEHKTTGRVAVGRQIVAVGYWHDGTFYARRFEDAATQPGG